MGRRSCASTKPPSTPSNPDVGTILGEHGRQAKKARESAAGAWIAEAVAAVKAGLPAAVVKAEPVRRVAA